METLQVDKFVTGNQPQIVDSKIYGSAPVMPYDGGHRYTRQPQITGYKIYSSKKLPVVLVRLTNAEASDEPFIINESDFDEAMHELA